MNEKVLSISIAAFNAEKWLNKCLNSFCDEDLLEDLEIIIVNDGSTDKTIEVAKSYNEKWPNSYRIIDKKNGGHGSTINEAKKIAKGKYFKAVDADDWVEQEGLKKLVLTLKNIDADLIYNSVYYVYQDTNQRELVGCSIGTENLPTGVIIPFDSNARNLRLSIHGMTIKTELIKNSTFYLDENCFYVDQEYIMYYLFGVEKLLILDFPVYNYLNGRKGQSVEFNSYINRRDQHAKVIRSLISFWNKNRTALGNGVNEMLIDQIAMIVCIQYKILLNIPNAHQSKKEMIEFNEYITKESPEIYNAALKRGKICRIINFITKFHYGGYQGVRNIIIKLNREKV